MNNNKFSIYKTNTTHVAILLGYLIICISLIAVNEILPYNQDDTIYFQSAKQFFLNFSCYGNSIIDFESSKIGQFNWYGPGYHLLFGTISYIFGFNEGKTILIFNVFIWAFITFFTAKKNPANGVIIILCFTLSPILFFEFSFYPVVTNCFISVSTFLFLMNYIETENLKSKFGFIFSLLIGTFLRISQIFLFALFYSKLNSRIQFLKTSLFFILLILFTWLFQTYFCAPMYIAADEKINMLFSKNAVHFLQIFLNNFTRQSFVYFSNFQASHFTIWASLLCLLLVPFTTQKENFKKYKPLFIGVIFTNIIFILFIFGLYSQKHFYIEKQFIILYPINALLTIIISNRIKYLLLLITIAFLPFTLLKIDEGFKISKRSCIEGQSINSLNNITELIKKNTNTKTNEIINILIDYQDFTKLSEWQISYLNCSLPLEANDGSLLRYIWLIRQKKENLTQSIDSNYYLISPFTRVKLNNFYCVDSLNNSYLYRHF